MESVFPENRDGSESLANPVQPENAELSIVATSPGTNSSSIQKQPENADSPMLVTLSGIVTDLNPEQL